MAEEEKKEQDNAQEETKEEPKTITIEESKIAEYEAKIAESEDLAKRMKADFENLKKNSEKEKQGYKALICSSFIEKLLPVLDTFDQAMLNTSSESERKGLGLVYSQMLDILSKEGLKPIETIGKTFDPYLHEILMKESSDKDDDEIIEEFQKGYTLGERVIRHSKVKVSEKKEE